MRGMQWTLESAIQTLEDAVENVTSYELDQILTAEEQNKVDAALNNLRDVLSTLRHEGRGE